MVDIQEPSLDAVFHALGDATRRRMLGSLAQGERTVGQLAEPFQMSLAAASKHVKALEGAGLIRREVRGRTHICRLEATPLAAASEWLRHYEQFWATRLDRLEALLREAPVERTASHTPAMKAAAERTSAHPPKPRQPRQPRQPRSPAKRKPR